MRVAGVVVALLGAALAVRCVLLLTGRGRPRRGPSPAFVLAGPYLRVRNPLLAGVLVASAGLAVLEASWLVTVLVAASFPAAHLWVVRVEEPRLLARFGAAYAAYLERVPRWLPRRQPIPD